MPKPLPELRQEGSHFRADVDNSAWDGPAAMSRCSNSDTPASCFRAICAGRKEGDPELQSSWALPHHKSPDSAPNAAGVRNALARLSQTQGLTNEEAARSHLERHMSAINPDRAQEPKQGLFRMVPNALARCRMVPNALARADAGTDGNTLQGYAAVFDTWADIEGYTGAFKERIQPGAFKKTITENGSQIKVMFNHGMDPQIGMKPLGKPSLIEEQKAGLYTETPLDDTSYNADLKASIRSGAIDGMSFQFDVIQDDWNEEHTERTIKEIKLYEFGPVTWPAYQSTTAGIRSKGIYGGYGGAVPPILPGRIAGDAPDDEGRDTLAEEKALEDAARLLRMRQKLRAFQEKHGKEGQTK